MTEQDWFNISRRGQTPIPKPPGPPDDGESFDGHHDSLPKALVLTSIAVLLLMLMLYTVAQMIHGWKGWN